MFKYRAISFPLLLALAGLVIFWKTGGPILFNALAVVIAFVAVLEMADLAEKAGIPSSRRILLLVTMAFVLIFGARYVLFLFSLQSDPNPKLILSMETLTMTGVFMFLFSFPACWLLMLVSRDRNLAVKQSLGTFGVLLFAGIPLFSLYYVYQGGFGAMDFLSLVLLSKAADTGGYVVGMLSNKILPGGNHKIVPAISPKKSWEGAIGGALFSIGAAAILTRCGVLSLSWLGVILLGFVSFVGSFAGDLTESQLKRAANVKDSANWIPGMGGVWDVLDSFIYNAPLYLIGMAWGIL